MILDCNMEAGTLQGPVKGAIRTPEGRNLMVLFPCYKQTNAMTAWALQAIAIDLGKERVRFSQELGNAMIYQARNKLAHDFIETGAEWSLWIDDDVVPPVGRAEWFKRIGNLPPEYPDKAAGLHVVDRLLSHKKKIIGGVYFGRQRTGPPMFAEMANPEAVAECRSFKDGIRATDWVATGCLLVHRDVYLDIRKAFPELAPEQAGTKKVWKMRWGDKAGKWTEANTGGKPEVFEKEEWVAGTKWWDYFKPETGKGEDVMFSYRARMAGHQVYVDTMCHSLHVGYNTFHALNTTGGTKG